MLMSSRLCSVRSLAIGKSLETQIADCRFVLKFTCVNTGGVSRLEQPCSIEGNSPGTRESTLDFIPLLMNETQLAWRSGDRSLQQHLAQIFQELAENRAQIERLSIAIKFRESRKYNSLIAFGNNINTQNKLINSVSTCEFTSTADSVADDILLDCVSRFSSGNSMSSINRLQEMFSGLPDYSFKTRSSFYPEQYMTDESFEDPVSLFAIAQLEQQYQTQRYFLFYAETP